MNEQLARLVRQRAHDGCEYCHLPAALSAIPFEIDHVIAQKHRGPTSEENLALACFYCNSANGPNIAGVDPLTGTIVPLFHPRRDLWAEHFQWRGEWLVPLSAIGRTTIEVLRMNDSEMLALRAALIGEGLFPPSPDTVA